MKNTKTKEPRYYRISVERDTITRVVEVDDGISDEELEDSESEFERYVKEDMLYEEMYGDNFVCVEKIPNHSEFLNPYERRMNELKCNSFLYRNKRGDFETSFPIEKGSESVILCWDSDDLQMVFLSSSLEKTKELWNKGEIEELKSHFVGFHGRNHPKEDKEVINKIYESRNESDEIEIKDKDEYQKQDGITEVLVERTTTKKGKNV